MENNIYEPIYMIYRKPGVSWKVIKMFKKEHFNKKDFKNTSFKQVINTLKDKFEEMCYSAKNLTILLEKILCKKNKLKN